MNNTHTATIAPLTKVTTTIQLTDDSQGKNANDRSFDFEFICGLGIQGLTGFELDLNEKKPGDRLALPVAAHQAADYFEHLLSPLLRVLNTCPPFNLFVEIRSVSAATERELVHALAQKVDNSSCGDGCSCGCQ